MAEAKRGRLAAIDLLPEEAHPHVQAAIRDLAENRRTAESIREELNGHLLALGLDPVSRSAFNRKSLALAKIGMNIRRSREMAAVFAEKLNDMPEGDVGMLITEMCKSIIYNITEEVAVMDLDVGAKMMKEISLAIYRLEQAGSISSKRRVAIEDRARETAVEAVNTVVKERGISDETAQAIIAKVLGKES